LRRTTEASDKFSSSRAWRTACVYLINTLFASFVKTRRIFVNDRDLTGIAVCKRPKLILLRSYFRPIRPSVATGDLSHNQLNADDLFDISTAITMPFTGRGMAAATSYRGFTARWLADAAAQHSTTRIPLPSVAPPAGDSRFARASPRRLRRLARPGEPNVQSFTSLPQQLSRIATKCYPA
jgi:hypothetical protein